MEIILLFIFFYIFLFKHFFPKGVYPYFSYIPLLITAIHIITTATYYNYVKYNGGDIALYYNEPLSAIDFNIRFLVGKGVVKILIFPFKKIGFSFLGICTLGAFISLKGYFKLFEMLKGTFSEKWHKNFLVFIPIFLLLSPGMHFWTSAFSKEALLFTAIVYLLCEIKKMKISILKIILLLFFIGIIRPYLLCGILAGGILATIISPAIKIRYKLWICVISMLTFLSSLMLLSVQMNIKNININYLISWLQNVNDCYMNENASIDLNSTSMIERFFYMAFRPSIFEAKKWTHIAVAIENVFLLACFLLTTWVIIIKRKELQRSFFTDFALLSGLNMWLILSVFIYNYGLAHRYKIMYVPFLLIALYQLFPKIVTVNKKNTPYLNKNYTSAE